MIYGERTVGIEAVQSYTRVRCYKKCDLDAFLADLNSVPWHTMEVFTLMINLLLEVIVYFCS